MVCIRDRNKGDFPRKSGQGASGDLGTLLVELTLESEGTNRLGTLVANDD